MKNKMIDRALYALLILGLLGLLLVNGLCFVLANAQSPETSCIYEAVFLNNAEVNGLFCQVRGSEAPYAYMTRDFHVTTEFLPAAAHQEWYGKTVTVHITGYKTQQVRNDDGDLTANEGFRVELTAEDPALQAYLHSYEMTFHITGSYEEQAKYTELMDFSDSQPLDITITGTFGCYGFDGTLNFGV